MTMGAGKNWYYYSVMSWKRQYIKADIILKESNLPFEEKALRKNKLRFANDDLRMI